MSRHEHIRPSRPSTRPGQPTGLKQALITHQRGLEIRKLFTERQAWGKPADHLHNRVHGPRVGGDQ